MSIWGTILDIGWRLKLRKIAIKVIAIILILLVLASPYFLIIDFVTYSPLVLTVWLLSAAYYVFVRSRSDR